MPRNYKPKNVHGRPEFAGEHNMVDGNKSIHKLKENEGELIDSISELLGISVMRCKTSNWTAELLEAEIIKFFQWCADKSVKPSEPALRLWLGVSSSTLYDWRTFPEKYKAISQIMGMAMSAMEMQYISRSEQYPTANLYLLKSKFGYKDSQSVEIISDRNNEDEIKATIEKLGLNK